MFDKEEDKKIEPQKIVKESVEKIAPGVVSERFWNIVRGLSLNSDAKISLYSSGFTLNYMLDEGTQLNFNYAYNTVKNEFILTNISITEEGKSSKSLLDNFSELNEDQLTKSLKAEYKIDDSKFVVNKNISFDDFEKVKDAIPELNLFTAHELYKISQLDHYKRVLKYKTIVNSRKLKSYFVGSVLKEYLYQPVSTFVVSAAMLYVAVHFSSFGEYVGIKNHVVPEWVAPSVVSMSVLHPRPVQEEMVLLMKTINNQGTSDAPKKELNEKPSKIIKINETDFYTVKHSDKLKKTYFIITHENDKGQLEVFYHEIDAERFPNLVKYAIGD